MRRPKDICYVVLCYAPDKSVNVHLVTQSLTRAYNTAERMKKCLSDDYHVCVTTSYFNALT